MSSVRRYVIVGNGFAGTTCGGTVAQARCQRVDYRCSPTSRIRCTTGSRCRRCCANRSPKSKVIIRDLAWHEKHAIDLRSEHARRARSTTKGRRVVAGGNEYPYDALLVATGGRPNPSELPGAAGAHNIFNFQYMDDTKAISEALETAKIAVSVGGSFIAYELAEAFVSRGVRDALADPRAAFSAPHAGRNRRRAARRSRARRRLHDPLQRRGQELRAFQRRRHQGDHDRQGTEIAADCVGIGLGLTINTELVQGTPIEIGTGIKCDDRLETAVKGIFAAGDAAEFYDPTADMHYRMGTWNNAGAHGKVVAANMAGGDVRYHDVPEYSSKIFSEQTITQFGLSPEYRNDLTMVRSIEPEKKWYRALWFRDDHLVGGLLIGKGNRAGKRRYLDAIKSEDRRSRKPITSRCCTGTPTSSSRLTDRRERWRDVLERTPRGRDAEKRFADAAGEHDRGGDRVPVDDAGHRFRSDQRTEERRCVGAPDRGSDRVHDRDRQRPHFHRKDLTRG